MKAAIFQGIGLGHKIESVPDPVPDDDEVIVQVERSGICATDLTMTECRASPSALDAMYAQVCHPGAILGHEFAGTVVARGSRVTSLALGDRVAPLAFSGCGACLTCLAGKADWCSHVRARMGGYGEFARAKQEFTVKVSDSLSFDAGALIEPMATSLHSTTLAELSQHSRVVVLGAGPIGLGLVHFCRRAGVRRVICIARTGRRRELALSLGADAFLTQSEALRDRVYGELNGPPDVVFEASGALGVIDQAVSLLRPRGTIVACSVNPLPDQVMHALAVLKEIRLQYAAAYSMAEFHTLAELFLMGTPLTQLITRHITLAEFPVEFERLRSGSSECKVMLSPAS